MIRPSSRLVALLLLGLVAFASAGCGRAPATAGVAPDATFVALDTDGDGRLSLAESHLPILAFQALDRNGDGYLDVLEWSAGTDTTDNTARAQQARDDQRNIVDQHRNGSTVRGVY